MSKSDNQLKHEVEEELRWDPKVNSAQIGVTVSGGAVSLLGAVDTCAETWAAEDATKRVGGVQAVFQNLTVNIQNAHKHSDLEIADAVYNAFRWNVHTPKTVSANVQKGEVTLEGEVMWNYQRAAAERLVRDLTGVIAVYNLVTLKQAQPSVAQVKEKVLAALQRQANSVTQSIRIDESGGKVTLSGHASSWQSIKNAANAAWAAPGVTEVVDQVKLSLNL